VSGLPARTKAIDGQCNVSPGTQPVGPRDNKLIKSATVMKKDYGRELARRRSSRPGEIPKEPQRAGICRDRIELNKFAGMQLHGSEGQQQRDYTKRAEYASARGHQRGPRMTDGAP